MPKTLTIATLALAAMLQAMPAAAQDRDYRRDDRVYEQRRDSRAYNNRRDRNRTYRGRRYAQDCRPSSGTTGTIAGAVGGGVIGNVLGGGTIGTLAGAGGGALLGRQLDKNTDRASKRRNGC